MKDLTWPAVVVVLAVLAALVVVFGLSDDAAIRNRVLGYFDSIVPFIVGSGAGATVGYARGYMKGAKAAERGIGSVTAQGQERSVDER